jgi:beta-1,4-N-acetylglucosaminyltransferase
MVIIGSGGHTQEMLRLLDALASSTTSERYPHRVYVVATTDSMGEQKTSNFERENFVHRGRFMVERLPRSREVGQSYVSSVWTTLVASIASLELLWRTR